MIKIICIGKIKENFYKEAIEEYIKRIRKFTKIEIIELMDEKIEDKKVCLKKESKKIKEKINKRDYLISLEIEGKNLNSIQFAEKINDINLNSYNNIVFIIGGSFGLDNSIKDITNYKLSFSKLTFPHQLFRIILLEQIYRSYKILNNEKYHK